MVVKFGVLPINGHLATRGSWLKFQTTIAAATWYFEFTHNGLEDSWSLTIKDATRTAVFDQKIVYGLLYKIEEAFCLIFADPNQVENTVTRTTLGTSVLGVVMEL